MSSGRTKLFSELGKGRISDSCYGTQEIKAFYVQVVVFFFVFFKQSRVVLDSKSTG